MELRGALADHLEEDLVQQPEDPDDIHLELGPPMPSEDHAAEEEVLERALLVLKVDHLSLVEDHHHLASEAATHTPKTF